jgi:hypothetical protein
MYIKENFYAKLEQLREDYDPRAKEDKRKNDKYIKRRNKHGLKSGDWNEKSKLINKKAVTGLDEDVLNEGALDKFVPPFKANGLHVEDKRGNSVLEVMQQGSLAKEVAACLNKHYNK